MNYAKKGKYPFNIVPTPSAKKVSYPRDFLMLNTQKRNSLTLPKRMKLHCLRTSKFTSLVS